MGVNGPKSDAAVALMADLRGSANETVTSRRSNPGTQPLTALM